MSFIDSINLLFSCKTYADWRAACDKIKDSHGGDYPEWWYREIVQTGLLWNITDKLSK
jgi:hypothetical protein